MEQDALVGMLTQDIDHAKEELEQYSQDRERMERLFNHLLCRYIELIENFAKDLKVVSPFDKDADLAFAYQENVQIIIRRLQAFLENGCSNEGMLERYDMDTDPIDLCLPADFNEARQTILSEDFAKYREKDEVVGRIDEIEEIYLMHHLTKKEKWELLRPYILWVSGKSFEVAMQVIPLFLKFYR